MCPPLSHVEEMFFFVLISRKYFKICQKKSDNVTVKKSGNSFAQETKIDTQGSVKPFKIARMNVAAEAMEEVDSHFISLYIR